MRRGITSVLLGAAVALTLSAGSAAAKPWAFNCAKAVSAKDATAIFGTSTKVLPGGVKTQCRLAPKARTTVDLGAAAATPARYQEYVTNNKSGTTTHGTTGVRTEIVSKAVSISGAKALQVENRRIRDAPGSKTEIRRSVFVYKKGHLLTMNAGPELTGPVATLKQMVALARKYAKTL